MKPGRYVHKELGPGELLPSEKDPTLPYFNLDDTVVRFQPDHQLEGRTLIQIVDIESLTPEKETKDEYTRC